MGKIRAAVTAVLMLFCMAYGNASELEREWDGVIYPRPQKILSEVEKIELIHGHFAMQIDPEARTSATIVTAIILPTQSRRNLLLFHIGRTPPVNG